MAEDNNEDIVKHLKVEIKIPDKVKKRMREDKILRTNIFRVDEFGNTTLDIEASNDEIVK